VTPRGLGSVSPELNGKEERTAGRGIGVFTSLQDRIVHLTGYNGGASERQRGKRMGKGIFSGASEKKTCGKGFVPMTKKKIENILDSNKREKSCDQMEAKRIREMTATDGVNQSRGGAASRMTRRSEGTLVGRRGSVAPGRVKRGRSRQTRPGGTDGKTREGNDRG